MKTAYDDVRGVISALPTPFNAEERVDLNALQALVQSQLSPDSTDLHLGVDGFVVYGTTGESATLNDREREQVTRSVIEVANGAHVIAGVGTNSTVETIRRATQAQAWGAGGGLVVTPYYNKPSQEGLARHFSAVAQATPDWPLILYVVPSRAQVTLEVDTLRRLLDRHPNIIAIKDATGDMLYGAQLIKACEGRAHVLSGDDLTALPLWSLGAMGSISVTSNLYPASFARLWRDVLSHRWSEARRDFLELLPLIEGLFIETNPVPLKEGLSWKLPHFNPKVRLPLAELSESSRVRLHQLDQRYRDWLDSEGPR
jgi:4-hydroxy-tetrahydrodipicolinate synthase